jgi:hypothetical protein
MRQQWESTIVTFTTQPAIDVLNNMGLDGWEPYAVTKTAVYFKRPIPAIGTAEQKYSSVPNNPFDELRDIIHEAWGDWKVKLNLS